MSADCATQRAYSRNLTCSYCLQSPYVRVRMAADCRGLQSRCSKLIVVAGARVKTAKPIGTYASKRSSVYQKSISHQFLKWLM
jgi:hypothetical protein